VSEPQHGPGSENPIDARIAAAIRWKARSLVGRAGLTRDDCPDMEQELAMRLFGPLRKFNSARCTRLSYAQLLIDRFAINLLRARRAAKRDGGPQSQLPDDLPEVADEAAVARALDWAAALEALPEELRRVAELMKTETVAGAARALGVSRDTVYARLDELRGRSEIRELVDIPITLPDSSRANRE
jgi:RNA polymerase sigma-70 factor (ECF subfamily)